MTKNEVSVERRRHKRYQVQDGAFVILRPSDAGACKLVNISTGGLAFDYLADEAPSIEPTQVEVFLTDSLFRMYEMPCQSIWGTCQSMRSRMVSFTRDAADYNLGN